MLFRLKRGRWNSKAQKFSSLIAPDIWLLGKNDFEHLAVVVPFGSSGSKKAEGVSVGRHLARRHKKIIIR